MDFVFRRSYRGPIKLAIFDWAGTTMDYGCLAPAVVFIEVFKQVVSEGVENRKRDLDEKPFDYAKAGISEYWIVDPEEHTITVLSLSGGTYRVHGEFKVGDRATSVLFPDFAAEVDAVFGAPRKHS